MHVQPYSISSISYQPKTSLPPPTPCLLLPFKFIKFSISAIIVPVSVYTKILLCFYHILCLFHISLIVRHSNSNLHTLYTQTMQSYDDKNKRENCWIKCGPITYALPVFIQISSFFWTICINIAVASNFLSSSPNKKKKENKVFELRCWYEALFRMGLLTPGPRVISLFSTHTNVTRLCGCGGVIVKPCHMYTFFRVKYTQKFHTFHTYAMYITIAFWNKINSCFSWESKCIT